MVMKLEIDVVARVIYESFNPPLTRSGAPMSIIDCGVELDFVKIAKDALEAAEHIRGEIAKLDAWIDTIDFAPMGA